MATVKDQLTNIVRVNLDDEISSRWSDAQLLTFFKQAVQRIIGVGYKNRLNFMRTTHETTITAGNTTLTPPSDFLVQSGLWRTDTKAPILQADDDDFEIEQNYTELSHYIFEDGVFELLAVSESDIPIKLKYYTAIDINAITLSDQTPWDGKLDYAITEYVQLRALQVDRYNTQSDASLLNDMEASIIMPFQDLDISLSESTGGFN